jgi:membrane-associated phospholipid phosphatase
MKRCTAVLATVAALAVTARGAAQPAPAAPAAAAQDDEPANVDEPASLDPLAPTPSFPVVGPTIPIPLPRTRGGEPLYWDTAWRRSNELDYTLIAVASVSTLLTAIVKPISRPWRGGILFDEDARKLRLDSYDQQATARDTSDVLVALSATYPFLIDSMVTAWWYRGNKQVAREMAVIDLETLAVTAAVQGLFSVVATRERPYGRTCGDGLPNESLDCITFGRYRSYFSGHTSLSFASASLVCTHHLNLKLFANGLADGLACVTAFAAAAATGTLRVVGDQHYASDVISGAIVGTGIGLGLPWLLHYRRGSGTTEARAPGGFRMQIVPTTSGASAVGTF